MNFSCHAKNKCSCGCIEQCCLLDGQLHTQPGCGCLDRKQRLPGHARCERFDRRGSHLAENSPGIPAKPARTSLRLAAGWHLPALRQTGSAGSAAAHRNCSWAAALRHPTCSGGSSPQACTSSGRRAFRPRGEIVISNVIQITVAQ